MLDGVNAFVASSGGVCALGVGKQRRLAVVRMTSSRGDSLGMPVSRRVLGRFFLGAAAGVALGGGQAADSWVWPAVAHAENVGGGAEFVVPQLPYPYDALEPVIDTRTMEIHHDKHLAAYVKNLNAALGKVDNPNLAQGATPEGRLRMLLGSLDKVKDPGQRTLLRNNGGGAANHMIFFDTLRTPREDNKPAGLLAAAVDKSFGSFEGFTEQFSAAATKQFGSGWAWLYKDRKSGQLVVKGYPNQDSPLLEGHIPILGIDVWEHAYYLNYQNRRPEYVQAFFQVINWDAVAARYS